VARKTKPSRQTVQKSKAPRAAARKRKPPAAPRHTAAGAGDAGPRPGLAEVDYKEWAKRAAAELEQRHDIKAATIPTRVWTRLFIRGLSPQDAAEQAAVSAYNTRSAAERLRSLLK
jgi:hypothetical protein